MHKLYTYEKIHTTYAKPLTEQKIRTIYADCYSRLEQIDKKKYKKTTRVNHDWTKVVKLTTPISLENLMEK